MNTQTVLKNILDAIKEESLENREIGRKQAEGMDRAMEIIRRHMGADDDGWIPIAERLPDDEQEVWVSTKTGCVCLAMYTERYGYGNQKGFMLNDGFLQTSHATAWQPSNAPDAYIPATEREQPSGGWQEQMASTFLSDSRL